MGPISHKVLRIWTAKIERDLFLIPTEMPTSMNEFFGANSSIDMSERVIWDDFTGV